MDEYNKVKYDNMINYLKGHVNLLEYMVNEVNSYSGELEDYIWYDNNSEFYDYFFSSKEEVARAVYYGGSNYCFVDEYVRFNAYGNLETITDLGRDEYLQDGVEEILDAFLEEYADNNVDIDDEIFKWMISDYYNEESEEE